MKIFTYDKADSAWVETAGDTLVEVVASTGRQTAVIAYLNYISESMTAEVQITLAVAESKVGDESFYAVSQWVANEIKPIVVDVRQQGQYRFPIPVSPNEDKLRFTMTATAPVECEVYLLPADSRL